MFKAIQVIQVMGGKVLVLGAKIIPDGRDSDSTGPLLLELRQPGDRKAGEPGGPCFVLDTA